MARVLRSRLHSNRRYSWPVREPTNGPRPKRGSFRVTVRIVSADTRQLRKTGRALKRLGRKGLAVPIVDAMAVAWVNTSVRKVPVDTGELRASIHVGQVLGSVSHAEATVEASAEHAGFPEFGTMHQSPQPYFRPGRDAAEQVVQRVGGRIGTEIARAIETGGDVNTHSLTG